jgi:hypothetical protein
MEGEHEQNEYRRNPETSFMLSPMTTNMNQMSSEEMEGKYKIVAIT